MKGRAPARIDAPGPLDPDPARCLPPHADPAPLLDDGFRKLEWLVRPAQRRACPCDLVRTERRAVCFFGALPVGCAETDDSAARDERRAVIPSGMLDGRCNGFRIVPVDPAGGPA